jgi:hypothetical protein
MSKVKHAAATMGRKGGKKKSTKKTAASRKNGKRGGRPKKIVQDGLVYVNEGGGTYIPLGKKP